MQPEKVPPSRSLRVSALFLGGLVYGIAQVAAGQAAAGQGSAVTEHLVVLSDSTARVDQTNGPKYGPNERANLWPNSLVKLLRVASPAGRAGSGLLGLEGNAHGYDIDAWKVSGNYEFDNRIGPYQEEITKGGRIPAHGATVMLGVGVTASLLPQQGSTLWIYWASCPDSKRFTVTVDGVVRGSFGAEKATSCAARRTEVFTGVDGGHTAMISAPAGKVFLYGAEWTSVEGGLVAANLAVGGATSTFYNSPAKLDFLRVIPNVRFVAVALGINDFAHEVSPEEYRKNLSTILREIRRDAPKAMIVIVNQYPIFGDGHRNATGVTQQTYWVIAQQLAKEGGLQYVSLPSIWGSFASIEARGYLASDHVHPSDLGGQQIAAEIARAAPALKR